VMVSHACKWYWKSFLSKLIWWLLLMFTSRSHRNAFVKVLASFVISFIHPIIERCSNSRRIQNLIFLILWLRTLSLSRLRNFASWFCSSLIFELLKLDLFWIFINIIYNNTFSQLRWSQRHIFLIRFQF
jgi:hypothetical protein